MNGCKYTDNASKNTKTNFTQRLGTYGSKLVQELQVKTKISCKIYLPKE